MFSASTLTIDLFLQKGLSRHAKSSSQRCFSQYYLTHYRKPLNGPSHYRVIDGAGLKVNKTKLNHSRK